MTYTVKDIQKILGDDFIYRGNLRMIQFSNVKPIFEANDQSLVWIKGSPQNLDQMLKTKATVILCSKNLVLPPEIFEEKCFILSDNPKLDFIRIAEALFGRRQLPGINPSSIIDHEAKIGKDVFIGPNCVIGKCVIGDNSSILGNNFIFDGVYIGCNVVINPGTVVGSDGFGYARNESGELEKFPHLGNVIIEDYVEIGSNTCIDRGTLGNTFIGFGSKIDNLVHIAHNVIVGKHCLIIANAMIGGSTSIGDYSWVAPSASLMNGIQIGSKVTVGMGSVVTKNIPNGETWTGIPSRPLKDFIELQKKLKNL
jgi:UDP-3-O-[3-hydroxymyristoyl] glucosamine N-acyltransferase